MSIHKSLFKTILSLALITSAVTAVSCTKKSSQSSSRKNEVIVYTYDSFASEWGPASKLTELFKNRTGLTVTFVDCGDAVQAFNRAVLEKDNTIADIVLGLDNNLTDEARKSGLFTVYKPNGSENISDGSLLKELGEDWLFTPYDYSHFALIWNTGSTLPEPESLSDLTKDIYKKKIILMDPRTSTPGLGFAAWTVAVYGEKYSDYWKALKPNILTMAPGWSTGWGMFLAGEAPLVISYTTSPAYNVEIENDRRYKALLFTEGHVEQVECAALLKNAPNTKGAKQFLDFLISEEAQNTLPLTQWMYPVNKRVILPESYSIAAPVPSRTLLTDSAKTKLAVEEITKILSE